MFRTKESGLDSRISQLEQWDFKLALTSSTRDFKWPQLRVLL